MIWRIIWTDPAAKDIGRLDRNLKARIHGAVGRYAETSYGDVKRLHGSTSEYRLRVGEWRVRFELDRRAQVLRVLHVLPRGSAYRD